MNYINNTAKTASVTQLGYLGIGVSNLDSWRTFAADVLGLQPNGETEQGSLLLRMDRYHHRFELLPTDYDDLAYVGWEAKDPEALAQLASRASAFGLDVRAGTAEEKASRMVMDLIKFDDPDGLPTEIYYGPRLDHTVFSSPRRTSFSADNTGLGHIVLSVADRETYIEYLTDVLGAKVTDFITSPNGGATPFFHVNARHHSIAVAKRQPEAVRRLNHFMIEATSLDEVGMARAAFVQKGIPVSPFGRHSNDRMFSFYGETPSGYRVEYGFGGVMVDDMIWEIGHHTVASLWGHGPLQREGAR